MWWWFCALGHVVERLNHMVQEVPLGIHDPNVTTKSTNVLNLVMEVALLHIKLYTPPILCNNPCCLKGLNKIQPPLLEMFREKYWLVSLQSLGHRFSQPLGFVTYLSHLISSNRYLGP